jgi:hypothetical protein
VWGLDMMNNFDPFQRRGWQAQLFEFRLPACLR